MPSRLYKEGPKQNTDTLQLNWSAGSGRALYLDMTWEEAESASHQGQCDQDVEALMRLPHIASQLEEMDAELLAAELKEYGAWDAEELADHQANLQRIVWIAAGGIQEEY